MAGYSTLTVEYSEGVGAITIDGSGPMNTLDVPTADDLHGAAIELSEDDAVRCITISGAGDAFGAGAGLPGMDGDASDAARMRRTAGALHDAILQFHQAEKPVVTAVNGIAAGAGFSLALVGDLVLVSDDARMDYAYQRMGLTGDGGSTFFLPRLVGLRKAKELLVLGEAIDPDRAVDLGLATETVPADRLDERLSEVATRLADGPTRALGRT
jgi:2-(1,2-epoxy-1,2-dihydrophenyl)acetyl-CoA isomerase